MKINWDIGIKTILYRIISMILGGIIVYILTGKWYMSLIFIIIDTVVKTIYYYYYEKFWIWYTAKRIS